MVDVNELELEALEAQQAPEDDDLDGDGPEGRTVYVDPFADGAFETDEDFVTDDGDTLPDEVQAELEALASAEFDDGNVALESALAEAQRELARQRTLTRQAVSRFRDALLAAPPTSAKMVAEEAAEKGIQVARIGLFRAGDGITATSGGTLVNLPETLGFEHG